MSDISTEYLQNCLNVLERAYELIKTVPEDTIDYEMYRNSLVQGFELTLEQSGKLLKKKITDFFASKKEVDKLTFKDIFRYAHKHSLINEKELSAGFYIGIIATVRRTTTAKSLQIKRWL